MEIWFFCCTVKDIARGKKKFKCQHHRMKRRREDKRASHETSLKDVAIDIERQIYIKQTSIWIEMITFCVVQIFHFCFVFCVLIETTKTFVANHSKQLFHLTSSFAFHFEFCVNGRVDFEIMSHRQKWWKDFQVFWNVA